MILLYIFAPIIILMSTLIWYIFKVYRLVGSKKVLISLIIPIAYILFQLANYISIVVIGGEISLPITLIGVRSILSIPFAIGALAIIKIFGLDSIEEEDEYLWVTVTFFLSIIYTVASAIFYNILPENLSIPWFRVALDITMSLSALAIVGIIGYILMQAIGGIKGIQDLANALKEGDAKIKSLHLYVSLVILLIYGAVALSIGAPGATLQGYPIIFTLWIAAIATFLNYLRALNLLKKKGKGLFAIILIFTASTFTFSLNPFKEKGLIDDSWGNELGFSIEVNSTNFPIDIVNVRLVDRALASDFAESFRLPKIGQYRLEIMDEYENIGLIDGKPAWILPVKYSYAFTPKINYMVGYLYIHLDTPTFESMKFVNKIMKVAPGLYGGADIEYFALSIVPDGMIGEMYLIDPSPVTSSPAWVVLLDKYTPWGIRAPYKVLIVGAEGDYKVYGWRDAIGIVPQVISYKSLRSIINKIGSSIRNGLKDYFAKGFIWIPASQDIQENLESSFYNRPHHFLLGNWWGRDYYTAIRTSGGEESVAVWTLINDTLIMFDLRYYKGIGGVERGVNPPEKALETMKKIISQKAIYGAQVRYPKLYKVEFNETTYLVWVALVVQKLPAADKPLGVVWVDASNPRISGYVQYVYGETHEIFMNRLHENIYVSYKGWQIGNETTLVTTTINGTILRKNWALLQPDNQYAIIMQIRNETGEIVTVIVLETKTATKQDFYNAVVAKEGDQVLIEARWDIDLQAWVAYTVKILNI